MVKIKGLGRGLDALLGGDDTPAPRDGRSLVELHIDALQPGKYQPRKHIEDAALRELADSIKAQGLLQPILARPIGNNRYEIIAGERRWRAARLAGLTAIPAQVRAINDKEALAMALIENIQREDLNPLEQALGIQQLIDEFSMTHEVAAQAVGRSRTTVTNLLRLLALTAPVRALMQRGVLDMGHARALLALSGVQQEEAARTVVARDLSVRETERLVALRLRAVRKPSSKSTDHDVLRLQEELAEKIGAKVQLEHGPKGHGKLVIHYHSLDELQGILDHIK